MKIGTCTIIKDEQDYLEEWIQYNISIGITDMYLYEDYGSKSHKEITDKYKQCHLFLIKDVDWESHDSLHAGSYRQVALYKWFIEQCNNKKIDLDWCAFIDPDEFITFEEGYDLKKLLEEYDNYPGIYLFWKMFGASGHIYKPEGKVQDNFTKECKLLERDSAWNFKSFVNFKFKSMNFGLRPPHSVRGLMNTSNIPSFKIPSYKKCWLNHYFTKSFEEWVNQIQKRGDVSKGNRKIDDFFECNNDMDQKKIMPLFFGYKNKDQKIPKVINYVWLSGEEIPDKYMNCIKTWKEKMPDYEYKLWTQENFPVDEHPFVKQAIDAKNWAFATDYIRLWVLYNYGGIYLDCDVKVSKPFDDLLDLPYVMCTESDNDRKTVEAACMMSEPHNKYIKIVLDWYNKQEYTDEFLKTFKTIPWMIKERLEDAGYRFYLIDKKSEFIEYSNYVNIFTCDFFSPINWRTKEFKASENTYAIHCFVSDWIDKFNLREKFKNE